MPFCRDGRLCSPLEFPGSLVLVKSTLGHVICAGCKGGSGLTVTQVGSTRDSGSLLSKQH